MSNQSRKGHSETVNPATRYVSRSKRTSPLHAYVADHGRPVPKREIGHTTVAGREIALSEEVTPDERALVEDAIRTTEPSDKACFADSLEMWEYSDRFEYVEGFAVIADLDVGGIEHE